MRRDHHYQLGERSSLPDHLHTAKIAEILGYDPFSAEGITLAARLVNWRKARGLRQKDLARQIGVDPSTLARFERGRRYPTGKYLSDIESVLKGGAS